MSPGHSEIMSPGVPTSCRLVERRPAGGWFLPSSGVLVNPLRLISVGFAAGRWNPAIAIAYGAPRAIRESAADMAATVHYAVDRSGFRRHTRPSPTRAAPHSSLEVSVPVPAPNRRALQRGCHLCSDTALSGWDRQSNPLSSSGESRANLNCASRVTGLHDIRQLRIQIERYFYTEPEAELSLLLKKLKLELPAQPPPKITEAPVPPIPLWCRPSGVSSSKLRYLGVQKCSNRRS
jgi:hypothetical protein